MKLKTYFLTLILFLLFFNGSIMLVSMINLDSNMKNIRECCLGEHYFISTSYSKDLNAVVGRNNSIDSSIESLFYSYTNYYKKKNVLLAVAKDNKFLFSNLPAGLDSSQYKKSSSQDRILSTIKSNGREYISITGALPAPYGRYTLCYLYDLTDDVDSWDRVTSLLYTAGVAISFLLALCLIFVLNYIFKPLKQISLASKNIAQGNYENRLPVNGKDELSEMAKNFNYMANEIQSQIVQLENAAEQKQNFIDNFAHELRTPLTSIYGYAEYIQRAVITDDEKLSATNYIMAESRRLQNLAYRLLDLATLRNENLTFIDIKISDLFETVNNTLEQKAALKHVKLVFNCGTDILKGDPELLACLLVNLTDNGIKACEQEGLVSLNAFDENGNKVITVEDNGRGIPKEHLSHIKEAFYRVDKSRSRNEGGAGLGLSLCEKIAIRHNASLSFSSEPKKGTVVKITFTTL